MCVHQGRCGIAVSSLAVLDSSLLWPHAILLATGSRVRAWSGSWLASFLCDSEGGGWSVGLDRVVSPGSLPRFLVPAFLATAIYRLSRARLRVVARSSTGPRLQLSWLVAIVAPYQGRCGFPG